MSGTTTASAVPARLLKARIFSNNTPLASPMNFDPRQMGDDSASSYFPFPAADRGKWGDQGTALFLGIDMSTQALKASFATEELTVIQEFVVRFDQDLPHYKTKSGVVVGSGGVVTSPVAMWIEAVDLLFTKIHASEGGTELLSRVASISGAAQQHASVYFSPLAPSLLASLSAAEPLLSQLKEAFSYPLSPNWQDSSTTAECREMEKLVGGFEEMAKRTGSRAHERFTGPQILRMRRLRPEIYEATDRIVLASTFLTTLLCADGEIKATEESDACGMNLWNLESGEGWDKDLIAIVAGGKGAAADELERKLGPVQKDGGVSAGMIGNYFVERYGMRNDCLICGFTGDNPATLLSFSLLSSDVIVSLGTSDTILLSTTTYAPTPDSHVFAHPANMADGAVRGYMGMLCYKNGSLPREHVRDTYAQGSWDKFNEYVKSHEGPKSNQEANQRELGFYFLKPEIIPHNGHGIHHFSKSGKAVKDFEDPTFNPRAILESQFLSFRMRSHAMLSSSITGGVPNKIYAVGGASSNQTVLAVLSTILGAPILQPSKNPPSTPSGSPPPVTAPNSCSVGGAYKAFWCWKRLNEGDEDELSGSSSHKSFELCIDEAKRSGLGLSQGVDDGVLVARQAESLGVALGKLEIGKEETEEEREEEEREEEEEEECREGLEVVARPERAMYDAYEGMVERFREAEAKTCGRD